MKDFNKPEVDKIIFISDVHLGVRNATIEWIENITKYFDNFFIPLVKKEKKTGNPIIVIAGDFFDNRQHIDINIMNVGAEIMDKLSKEVEVYITIGNHDIYKKKDTNVSSLRLFKSFKNVKLIEELSTLTIKDNFKFLLIPWVGDAAEESEILRKHNKGIYAAVMHSDIAGLNYDNGRQIINGVNSSEFGTGKIYSGHIHKRQSNNNVTYLGAPYQLRRSDIGNTKGIYILTVNNSNIEEKFIENTYSPIFMKIQLEDILDKNAIEIKKIVENNYVDIIIKKKYINDINTAKLMEVMDFCNTRKIEIIADKTDINDLDIDTEINNDLTIEEIFKRRLSTLELSDESKNALIQMNNNYLTIAAETLGTELNPD